MKKKLMLLLVPALFIAGAAWAENQVSTLRGDADLNALGDPENIPKVVNSDIRKKRNYPEQPPLIPHKIDNYQIDININKCLECHRREVIEDSGAPMVSVTHYMDRENQVLSQISPRRYFCTQCHVPQHDTKPLVDNGFVDASDLIEYLKKSAEEAE